MAFFHELIAELEHKREGSPGGECCVLPREAGVDVPDEVLKFAPRKTRLQHHLAEDQIEQLETEIKQWQDRADRAETRLRSIEDSIQKIAAKCVRLVPKE